MLPVLVEDQAAVDFIGADEQVMALAEGGDGLEFRALPGPANRVVRMAKQQQAAAGRQRGFQRREIPAPAAIALTQRGARQPPAGQARRGEKWRIDGRRRQDIAVDAPAGDVEAADQTGQPQQPVGLDPPTVRAPQVPENGIVERRRWHGVAETALRDTLFDGRDDRRRRGKIHVRNP